MRHVLLLLSVISYGITFAQQTGTLTGTVSSGQNCVGYAQIGIRELNKSTTTDNNGNFALENIPFGTYTLIVQDFDQSRYDTTVVIAHAHTYLDISLEAKSQFIEEVVVSGALKEVSKLESTVAIEVYSPRFFARNPSVNLFEGLQNINGVRPQINCNVCNTGDIHINGLEGPYTMVLIDGMPSVSSLSTVYGLSGIPMSLVERIEIIRGPASSLYGSEAIGGIINVITKDARKAPLLSVDAMSNTWWENNLDLGGKFNLGERISVLNGLNVFYFDNPVDNNNDGFTDLTLQKRVSIFQKWSVKRKDNRLMTIGARYFYEDRWGGETNWNKTFRGSDSIYGESIYTSRWELFGTYQLPMKERFVLSYSANEHIQNSYYGTTAYMATQRILFGQLVYYKTLGRQDLLAGVSYRNTYYDDNTPATFSEDSLSNMPSLSVLPGIFVQDEWHLTEKANLLVGGRWDYNRYHGNIFTPRLGVKYNFKPTQLVRVNAGTGYRVVNVFTEDHAALTGARKTEITEDLLPETSYNINANYYHSFAFLSGNRFIVDLTAFYTYFGNKILPDYLSDPNKIIYSNVDGHAESTGISANLETRFNNGLSVMVGGTYMDVSVTENGIRSRQLLTEKFTGTWTISLPIRRLDLNLDYTGNVYSPMLLPTLGETDPRSGSSPWWSIQNIKLSYTGIRKLEIYGGVKNLLNWTPGKTEPFLIARSHDPFDKEVQFTPDGSVVPDASNPYGLTFDPTYVYGPNQGARFFLGVKVEL